jgi:hypothetical protein
MSNPDNTWAVIRELGLFIITTLWGLVMLMFRRSLTKIDDDMKDIKLSLGNKAEKDDVDRRHVENSRRLDSLQNAEDKANEVRESMWKALSDIGGDVKVLLDRSDRDEKRKHVR